MAVAARSTGTPSEKRFNWELVFCELYAGGKYNNNQGGDYDFSLGTNGLGSCATQYASEYMDVTVWRDGNKYSLHFKKGKVVGAKKKALEIEPSNEDRTGTTIKWRPDLEVFTSISIPHEWYRETMRRQAVVNANVTFRLRIEGDDGEFSGRGLLLSQGHRGLCAREGRYRLPHRALSLSRPTVAVATVKTCPITT